MEYCNISIRDREYKVILAQTQEERKKGLLGVTKLDEDKGMLFIFDSPQTVTFWMKDTKIPLDIIFIDEDQEVISIYKGQPNDENLVEEDGVKYVLEVNLNSGIKIGDDLEFEDDEDDDVPTMKVIDASGNVLMELVGGERIFSRKNTRTLIRMARKADLTKKDSDYKRLGKKMFSYINLLDNREPDYVELKDRK